jgi:5-oxoprolinase (ATP-hydrolysing)
MWEFWIDVGGTFTDCIARTPDDRLIPLKVLSSGATKGCCQTMSGANGFRDVARSRDPSGFWVGYGIRFAGHTGETLFATTVVDFDCRTGEFTTEASLPVDLPAAARYELFSDEESPLVAIRYLLQLRRDQPVPPISVRLGTTRGTNALLTRNGARTAFVTTSGFADVLRIANQDRPRLFDLAIRKPDALFEKVIEIHERVDAGGKVLHAPDPLVIRQQFAELRQAGIESIAICLMHSFAYPQHEQVVEAAAREAGFTEISVSSRLAPLMKIVSRGDTTVVDAYLNPVLRRYVKSLQLALGTSTLRLMTSAGGLVAADQFTGKDSILSGPAGGVIGFSTVAQGAGFAKAIGFDMGGTSTDVSRFDGRYELEYETKKAGVRIVAPMLAIETVAAGGGSRCGYDGVKLTVGPGSAGSDPGPACYGRGGPLTVTDANLYLGKILSDRFPFPLDLRPVESQLQQLCEQIANSPDGVRYTPHELAEGFVRIANANMVRPIRSISVARGYDPREYLLVTFGSAGGQHACAIARELGMRQILSHPFAGLLSAYGIGMADVRRHAESAVQQICSREQIEKLSPLFAELERGCQQAIEAEGLTLQNMLTPIRSLDLRYRGVEATINIPCPADGDYAKRYEELHLQLYGYKHTREIEITAARVEVVARLDRPAEPPSATVLRHPAAAITTTTWFQGRDYQTRVFTREELRPGDEIIGPAIVCEPSSTVLIDPGFTAAVLSRGEILITDTAGPAIESASAASADPVMLEIFNNHFASIAEQMGITLQRTAFSTNVKDRLDFSCALFSATGDLVVNAPHIPVHLGAMGQTVQRILRDNPVISAGDVYVTNDPYRGGSHLPDITVVTPIHDDETGELLFLTASRAHHAEIGGILPGSMPPFSTHLGEEGVLIRNFKLLDRGQSREVEFRELLLAGVWPTRAIRDNLADLSAQVAANQLGADSLRDLVRRHSLPVVLAYMRHIQQAAERKMRIALRAIPDGVYRWTDHLDDGSPLVVAITIEGDSAVVDFAGTGPVLPGNLNANRAIVTAAVLYVFRCLINEEIPLNSGVLAPIRILLPDCFLNPVEHLDPAQCAAIVGGNVETSQRVVDALLGALGLAAASQGTMNNLTFGDETFGYYETICGGSGATRDADGADAVHTHMTNTRLTDPEVLEWRYPVRVREFSIRRGSGGAGRHRGGDGVVRRLEFLKRLRLSILSERRGPYAPFGLEHGLPGALGKNALQRVETSSAANVGGKVQTTVEPGDVLTIETPGGGGFGTKNDDLMYRKNL